MAMLKAEDGVPPQEKADIVSVLIPHAAAEADGVVYYQCAVAGSFSSWFVRKRYSQFEQMYSSLLESFNHQLPKGAVLPPKKIKLFQKHASKEFIETRRVLLSNMIKKLLSEKDVRDHRTTVAFFTSDKIDASDEAKRGLQEENKRAAGRDGDLPEDVEVTDVEIPSTRCMSDHVLYQVDVSNARLRKTFSKWTMLKRFGQFYEMDAAIRQMITARHTEKGDVEAALARLPPCPQRKAKLFNDHMDAAFIEERRALLEAYLKKMIAVEEVVRNDEFLNFLGVKS